MIYAEAVAYLDSFTNYERLRQPQALREVQLGRMHGLCERLGDPQRRFRSILVTGTNGKGSVCAMLYGMLRRSSLRVGLYTSPHVEHLRERIRVSDPASRECTAEHAADWITAEEFAALMSMLRPVLGAMREPPTYFEVLTALAFLHFSRRQVELAVLEIGLGGRLDATNVVQQSISVITPIDVDHTDVLGLDPRAIAAEKAGIIKPRQTVISAPQPEEVLQVLQEACERQGAPLVVCGRDLTARIERHDLDGLQVTVTGLRGIYESLSLPLIGRHQADNAAAAIAALEALSNTGVPRAMVEEGLAAVEWPGRLEVVHDAPLVLLDGAHNPQAAEALAKTLRELCPDRRVHVVIGMLSNKLVDKVGAQLGTLASAVTCTRSRHPRALDPTALAKHLKPFCSDVHVMSDPIDAYTYLLNAVASEDVIVVTGSLYLVGELRAALRRSHVRPRRAAAVAS
jgi:dihydrofolate synthase/folylpolyglutamate synthase